MAIIDQLGDPMGPLVDFPVVNRSRLRAVREDRVLEAARAALQASGHFRAARDGTPWTAPVEAGMPAVAWIELDRIAEEDRTFESKVVTATMTLWVGASRPRPTDARRAAALLLAAAKLTLSGSSLGGLVEPAFTRVTGGRFLPQVEPQFFVVEAAVRCRWVESDWARDTADRVVAL